MYELQTWLGTPCIYVLDCSAAGLIINSFKAMLEQRQQQQAAAAAGLMGSAAAAAAAAGLGLPDPMREIIVLGACAGNELLPQVGKWPLVQSGCSLSS
jgi:regulator-associated protein of mTOR